MKMRLLLFQISPLLYLLTETGAAGIGKAWQILPYATDYWNHPSWPRLDSSAFEVRSVSGVGHLSPIEITQSDPKKLIQHQPKSVEPNAVRTSKTRSAFNQKHTVDRLEPIVEDSYENRDETNKDAKVEDKILGTRIAKTVLRPEDDRNPSKDEAMKTVSRGRRDTENETKLEQISSSKNVREVRLSSPENWSTQPLSIEFSSHRTGLDQMIQQTVDDEELPNARGYHAPRADFVTSPHRRSYDYREARDMPVTRGYDDYDVPWYRSVVRDRDYDPPSAYRRGYNYYYPDRYRMERDYYMRIPPNEYSYYYDRYRDEDLDLYGRSRPTPKPKRIIYYATLPEIVRKPVDLRNYPRPYDGTRTVPVSRDGSYKRIPGNVDPNRYRYRHLYDGYDNYSKRSSFAERPYPYPEDKEESRRKATLENLRNNDPYDQNGDRKLANQISVRNDGKLPWPVQIGTEVSVKDNERISGRKIFGEGNGYERFQSAQLQKAPDATGSSELQSDN